MLQPFPNDDLQGMSKAAIVVYFGYYPNVYLEGLMDITSFWIDISSPILHYRSTVCEIGKVALREVKSERSNLRYRFAYRVKR